LRSTDGGGPLVDFGCGLAFVGVSCFRHDLFAYLCVPVAVVALTLGPRPRMLPFVLGAALPALAVWGPVVARADWRLVIHDLVIHRARFVRPARALPLPIPWRDCASLAECLGDPLVGAVALGLVAPVLGVVVVAGGRRLRLSDRRPA